MFEALYGVGALIVLSALFFVVAQRYLAPKVEEKERLKLRYDSGSLIYESSYEFRVPKRPDLMDFIFNRIPRRCKIDLSKAGELRYYDVQVKIDRRPMTFKKEINWSSKNFDVIKMFDDSSDYNFEDYDGDIFNLTFQYIVWCPIGKLKDLEYLKIDNPKYKNDCIEISIKNTGVIDVNELRYEQELSLDKFVKKVEVEKLGEPQGERPFSVTFTQRSITSYDQCTSLISQPPKENYHLDIACSFVLNLKRNESILVRIYYLNT
jgi:hypothetical protein